MVVPAIGVLDALGRDRKVVVLTIEEEVPRSEQQVVGKLVVLGPSLLPSDHPIGLGVVEGQMLGVVDRSRNRGRR